MDNDSEILTKYGVGSGASAPQSAGNDDDILKKYGMNDKFTGFKKGGSGNSLLHDFVTGIPGSVEPVNAAELIGTSMIGGSVPVIGKAINTLGQGAAAAMGWHGGGAILRKLGLSTH